MSYAPLRYDGHKDRLQKKHQRVAALEVLLNMHVEVGEPDNKYLQGLRHRLLLAKAQLKNMRQC